MNRSWISVLCVLVCACDENPKVIDPFPIQVDLSSGPVVLAASERDSDPVDITVDVLSPITVLDSYRSGDSTAPARRRLVELTVLGLNQSGEPGVPRVRFPETPAYDLHPCQEANRPPEPCKVGLDESTREIFGILGADILARSSVRFDFTQSEMRFFPDAAGSDSERTLACDAVVDAPYGGGGTLLIGGSEVRYGANRPTIGTCIHSLPIEEPGLEDNDLGTDLHMAISTAIGPTILSESAYIRYASDGIAQPIENLPPTVLHLLSGPVAARLGSVAFMALVGDIGEDSKGRGPCRELYANARMRNEGGCLNSSVDCPCSGGQESCKAAAAVELARSIPVVVVDSGLPILQALRDELRPKIPELDGVIGVDALKALRVEFDFPNNRLLLRCRDLESCTTRPQVRSQNTLQVLDECRAQEEALRTPVMPSPDAGPVP